MPKRNQIPVIQMARALKRIYYDKEDLLHVVKETVFSHTMDPVEHENEYKLRSRVSHWKNTVDRELSENPEFRAQCEHEGIEVNPVE